MVLRIRAATQFIYYLDGTPLAEVLEQEDLGTTITNNLKPSRHIQLKTNKAKQHIGMIKRCFSDRSPLTISTLYKSLIRPIIEVNSAAWSPWLGKDKLLLNSVQESCKNLCDTPLYFEPLEQRRERADLRETYKILNGMYNIDKNIFFEDSAIQLRGHSRKLQMSYSRTEVRKNFFSQRVVIPWNNLPESTINAPTVQSFKRRHEPDATG